MSNSRHITIIEPQKTWVTLELGELWRYRDLFTQLVWRDFSSRYRQSVIGIGWALIRPAVSMIIFTIIFKGVANLPSDGIPYPIFNYTALIPWMYFSGCLTNSSTSVVGSSGLLTKVYFPRLILPLSKAAIGLVDVVIQFALLVVLMIWYGVAPTWGVLMLPFLLLMCAVGGLSVGLWLTALNVKYRDITHAIPFLSQMWMWITPIVYPSSMVPERWRVVYGLNPMVGVVEGFRWALLGKAAPDWTMMAASAAVIVLLFVGGLYYFRRTEATFADVI
jgi:lipopolysaccharide transport system permease protein